MGYSFYHDCGSGRVFSKDLNACVAPWLVEECEVTTSTTVSTTKESVTILFNHKQNFQPEQ